jgi:hypothetical protein
VRDLAALVGHPHVARPLWWYAPKVHLHLPGLHHVNRTFVGLFAGCSELSKLFRDLGWIVRSIDIANGSHRDLTIINNNKRVFKLTNAADYVHVALPCNAYSSAL